MASSGRTEKNIRGENVPSWTRTPLGDGGLCLIRPPVFSDERGCFMETWRERVFERLGIPDRFVQDNQSLSLRRFTLRGIHFQRPPAEQAKLIRCLSGRIRDVAVDLRPESPDFLRPRLIALDGDSPTMLYIPKGFGHGFLTLEDRTVVAYRTDAFYAPECEGAILWNDEALAVPWGMPEGISPVLSGKDRTAPPLQAFLEGLERR